jgi:phosphohistidine phosphatase
MDLILWRHADAADGSPDHARELTAKGRNQASRMAAWLNQRLPQDTVVLVSPAVRAQQTAQALKREFSTCGALDTDSDCAAVLKAVGTPRDSGTTLIVGHQPTLGRVAALLLTGEAGEMNVKKGAVWWLGVRRGYKTVAQLRAVMTPRLL